MEKRSSCRQRQVNTIERGTHFENNIIIRLSGAFTIYLELFFNLVSSLENVNVYMCSTN